METGIRRRDFFKALAAGGTATAALSACSDKPEKLIPYLLPPDNVEFVPGKPLEYATTCMECPANCGMIAVTREGRAIKAEGNPDHPLSQGALCIRGQASLQTLYNPARISGPMRREGDAWSPLPRAEAEGLLVNAIRGVSDRRQIVYMTSNVAGSRAAFLDKLLGALGASPKVVLEPLGSHALRAANKRSFGRDEIPQYAIGQAKFIINFGAEFLETWHNPVENSRGFADMHSFDAKTGEKGKVVHVGPHQSLTGVNADQWISAKPGSEGVLALALAGEVLRRTRARLTATEKDRIGAYLAPYTIEMAAEASGADAGALKELAKAFAAAAPSLALAGGNTLASANATDTVAAVNLLNYVAGNVGETVRFGANRRIDPSTPMADVLKVVQRMAAGDVKLLIVDGANPLYHLPASAKVGEALAKVQTIVSLSSAMDETTARAHLALPGLTAMERWGDANPQGGVYSLIQPAMMPVFALLANDGGPLNEAELPRQAEDTLLAVAAQMGLTDFNATPTYKDVIRANLMQVQKDIGNGQDFETFWRASLQKGGVFQEFAGSSSVRLSDDALQGGAKVAELSGEGLALLPTVSLRHRDGRGASNPWLQEIPDPVSQVVWDTWVDIHPETARSMGIAHGEMLKITSPNGEIEAPAYLHYGVHREAIAIPMGQGHTNSGRAADLVGANVLDLLPAQTDAASGDFAYLATRVKVSKAGRPGKMVETAGSPRQLDRHIIQTISLEDARAGKAPKDPMHHPPHHHANMDFYPSRAEQTPGYHDPYRWGMVVDSDRCTGCSACVGACYAENNLPVVGKNRMAMGREMAWISINRFIEGKGDSYQTLMQPAMCQQCANAGCEPVCPVYATYHNPDGLNAQVYNRCVGTRYCSNNCAYKARRFNWFNYEWEQPLHLQLNPDVTVRSKGVMEKCTFCVQRIVRARRDAQAEGRELRDGEVTPACVQTCPTKALTFGNMADAGSEVSKKAMRGKDYKDRVHQYEVFPELKQEPGITFLRKVTFQSNEEA